ncbi:hypothetical protein J2J97_32540 (plasmid) [Rhizobium bangladeshense]|uniref:hypothetical protein n=1 Tax=Rhizobium bangladeshense TaxID=1138189 RepID=UPI001A999631|nr:hypothetical protein [Rhizobium bangladeshense]QSY98634.1 hypothetical protein J2J97_32540 [Rhizobium bangladeshense]
MNSMVMTEKPRLVQRLAGALSSTIVPLGHKRPAMFDRVLRNAFERMGFNNPDDHIGAVKEKIAETILNEIGPVMSTADYRKMKTYVDYGMSIEKAAALFSLSPAEAKKMLAGKGLVRTKE